MDLFNKKRVKILEDRITNKDIEIQKLENDKNKLTENLDIYKIKVHSIETDYKEKIKQLRKDMQKQNDIHKITCSELSDIKKKNKELTEQVVDLQSEKEQNESDIKRLENKVEFLRNQRRAPSVQEIIAYDRGYKEVEKRQKEADRKRRESDDC